MTTTDTGSVADGRRRAVDHLQRLYGVVAGLAVTEMLRRLLLSPKNTDQLPHLTTGLVAISFFATLLPFYHGANRYLDMAYVTGERPARHSALIVDFLFLFFEAVLFFVLALFLDNYRWFYTACMLLFLYDVVWVTTTYFTADHSTQAAAKPLVFTAWIVFNVVSAILIGLVVWSRLFPTDIIRNIALTSIAVLRSVLDYVLMWKSVYFPQDKHDTATALR